MLGKTPIYQSFFLFYNEKILCERMCCRKKRRTFVVRIFVDEMKSYYEKKLFCTSNAI